MFLDFSNFLKIDLLGKNGVCLEESRLKHLSNFIKCILKPILSQFDVLSVQKCVHGQVQGFSKTPSLLSLLLLDFFN